MLGLLVYVVVRLDCLISGLRDLGTGVGNSFCFANLLCWLLVVCVTGSFLGLCFVVIICYILGICDY